MGAMTFAAVTTDAALSEVSSSAATAGSIFGTALDPSSSFKENKPSRRAGHEYNFRTGHVCRWRAGPHYHNFRSFPQDGASPVSGCRLRRALVKRLVPEKIKQ